MRYYFKFGQLVSFSFLFLFRLLSFSSFVYSVRSNTRSRSARCGMLYINSPSPGLLITQLLGLAAASAISSGKQLSYRSFARTHESRDDSHDVLASIRKINLKKESSTTKETSGVMIRRKGAEAAVAASSGCRRVRRWIQAGRSRHCSSISPLFLGAHAFEMAGSAPAAIRRPRKSVDGSAGRERCPACRAERCRP